MRRRGRISLAIGGLALLVSVLAIGSAVRWAMAIVAVLVALSLVVQINERRGLDRLSPILALIGIAIVLTAVQLVPLPPSIIAALNPTGAGLRADGAALAGTSPWPCLSMDPAGTLRSLVYFVTLFGVASLSLRFGASERGRYYLLGGVAVTCGIAAGVTGFHTLAQMTSLYGVYEPAHAAPPILGPLLNANHLGCLMALGATVALGLVFYERQHSNLRVLWVVIVLGCSITVFGSESRGAAIALGLGVVVCLATVVGARLGARDQTSRQRRGSLARDVPMALVVAIGLAVCVYATAGNVADQIDNTSLSDVGHPLSKFQAWKSSIDLVAETPWIGVGRGATEPTLTRVHSASAFATFSHLENEYVAAIVEWGVPGALALGLVLGWCIITAMRRWRDGPLAAAALGASAAVMFQSSVDFGIEVFGVAIPATIVAATLLVVPYRDGQPRQRLRLQRAGLVLALLVAAGVVLLPQTRSLSEDHDAIQAMQDPTAADLTPIIERHPLDYFGFAHEAELMLRTGDPRAIRTLNHALLLHPYHPGLHRLAALVLVANKRPHQAALEYAAAMNGTIEPKPLLAEIVARLTDLDDIANAIPADWDPEEKIENALNDLKRQDVLMRWLQRAVQTPQGDTRLVDELYYMAMGRPDYAAAEKAALRRLEIAHTFTSRLMLARTQMKLGKLAEIVSGLADVAKWHDPIDEHGEAWLILCDAYAGLEQTDNGLQCLHDLDATGMMFTRRAEIIRRQKDLEERRAVSVKLRELTGSGAAP